MKHHTPGPWRHVEHGSSGHHYIQVLDGSWDIAHNEFSARDWDEERANARLIAAAPDLLRALRAIVGLGVVPSGQPEYRLMIDAIDKAIEWPVPK